MDEKKIREATLTEDGGALITAIKALAVDAAKRARAERDKRTAFTTSEWLRIREDVEEVAAVCVGFTFAAVFAAFGAETDERLKKIEERLAALEKRTT